VRRGLRWTLHRWRRSLQTRVAVTTLVAAVSWWVLVGVILMHQIARGVLDNKPARREAEIPLGPVGHQNRWAASRRPTP